MVLCLLTASATGHAQTENAITLEANDPGEDLSGTPGDPSVDDPAAPIDGGLSLLLAAGAAYGVRRVRRRSKRHDGENP